MRKLETFVISRPHFLSLFRVFTRVAVIPFEFIETAQSLQNSITMQREMKSVLTNAVRSVGKVFELCNSFDDMLEDELFQEILKINAISELDMRSSKNFSMLLYATGKVTYSSYS